MMLYKVTPSGNGAGGMQFIELQWDSIGDSIKHSYRCNYDKNTSKRTYEQKRD